MTIEIDRCLITRLSMEEGFQKSGRQVYGAVKPHALTDLRILQLELRLIGHSTTDQAIRSSGLLKVQKSIYDR